MAGQRGRVNAGGYLHAPAEIVSCARVAWVLWEGARVAACSAATAVGLWEAEGIY